MVSSVESVRMDQQGTFKYIQICINDGQSVTTVIRGWLDCDYHADVLDKFNSKERQPAGVKVYCPGGGRITIKDKKIVIFGYSVGFGKADHAVTCQIIQEAMPDYTVEWNNDGY